jgi:hypothetical protein
MDLALATIMGTSLLIKTGASTSKNAQSTLCSLLLQLLGLLR